MRYFLLLSLLLAACSHSEQKPALQSFQEPDASRYDKIVVVGTNDFHGYLRTVETDVGAQAPQSAENVKLLSGGAEWFGGYVRILEKKYGDRLVILDGGDIFQGTLDSNSFLGKSTLAYYNEIPYRALAVGNHEFDYGPRKEGGADRLGALKDLMAASKAPFVQSNIFVKKTGKVWKEKGLHENLMIKAGPYKIGIIGLTTTTTPAKTLPKNIGALEFREFASSAMTQAKKLRSEGADFIFVTTHEGGEEEGEPLNAFLKAIPPGTVDAVVAGHSHTIIHEFVHGVPVIESKTQGVLFGRIDLYVDKSTRKINPSLTRIHDPQMICGNWMATIESCDPKVAKQLAGSGKILPLRNAYYEGVEVKKDERIVKKLAPFFAKTDSLKKEVLTEAAADFEPYPSGENQTGDLFLFAIHNAAPSAKVIYLNGGGIRKFFLKGPITYGDLYEVHPFDNFLSLAKINGAKLKDLMRVGLSGSQAIPNIWGVKVSYKKSDSPEQLRDVNGDGKKETWEKDKLVSLTWMDGTPVKDEETFWLATNSYLLTGGDKTDHIFGDLSATEKKQLDITQRDVVAQYLRKHKSLRLPIKEDMRIKALP